MSSPLTENWDWMFQHIGPTECRTPEPFRASGLTFLHEIALMRPPFILYTFRIKKVLGALTQGQRPTETAHQVLSLHGFSVEVRNYSSKEWCCIDGSTAPENAASNPPTYATQNARNPNTKLQ